jgi:hypothetical protein
MFVLGMLQSIQKIPNEATVGMTSLWNDVTVSCFRLLCSAKSDGTAGRPPGHEAKHGLYQERYANSAITIFFLGYSTSSADLRGLCVKSL